MHPSAVPGRIVVAMSGGVDSSVAAWLLREAGADVVGLFMRNGVHVDEKDAGKKSCCSVGDARDARMVAAGLGLPFQAVDLKEEFGGIIRYFLAEYARGRTPNPCAVCNRDLKFRRLMQFADELGAAGVATGHYARIERERGTVAVYRGRDAHKDQSYQLFSVAEADLARTWLPLGGYTKPEVRALAEQAGLRTAKKKDSQEICFVAAGEHAGFVGTRTAMPTGVIQDREGHVLGRHEGVHRFTIGQRRGHGVGGGTPLFVVALEPETGTVVLGTRDECGARELQLEDLNLIGFTPPGSGAFRAAVQVRYHHEPAAAEVVPEGSGARVVFDEPVLSVAPGQGAAFYDGLRLLGGGWIARAERG